MAATIAGVALLVILYTYIGYPLLLGAMSAGRGAHGNRPPLELPNITIVIAAFNDEKVLSPKLCSLLGVSYPLEKIQVLIVDDGSTDGTAEIAAKHYPGLKVSVTSLETNAGKPSALNIAMRSVDTDITVFMDARQHVDPDCLVKLVRRFDDPSVGAVSGELVIVDEINPEQVSVGLYWRYEKWMRERESAIHSTAGATGAIYAIRSSLYRPLASDTVLDDFDTPMQILKSGKRVVFESGAMVYDRSQDKLDDEFDRKLRTLAGNYQSFHRHNWLFDARANPIFWQFISHKVLRVAVPWMALLLFTCSWIAASGSVFWATLFAAQVAFYLCAVLTKHINALRRVQLFSFILTFCQLNLAAAMAPFRYYSGRLSVRWRA